MNFELVNSLPNSFMNKFTRITIRPGTQHHHLVGILGTPRNHHSFTKHTTSLSHPTRISRNNPPFFHHNPNHTHNTRPTSTMPNEVDRTIYEHTTGAAATTASAHEPEKPLKLYAGWFCPFVQRTWITLNEKRIDYQYIEINPYHKDPEFLKLNPRGLVPTLGVEVPTPVVSEKENGTTTNGTTQRKPKLKPLYESIVIAEYLDEHYCDPARHGPRLLPSGTDTLSAYDRARCRLWIDHINSRIVPSFYRFLQHTPEKTYSVEDARSEFLGHIKTWTREMLELDAEREDAGVPSGPFFLGETFSLVDVTLAPWALRMFLIEHYKPGGVGIPGDGEGGKDEEVWRRWKKWFEAVEGRESVVCTMSEKEKYVDVYKRYAEDETGSQVGQATRGGRGLP